MILPKDHRTLHRQVVTTIMATEALRTRLDNLTWEKDQLKAENRRLQEEHPDLSRTLQLEKELEQSRTEAEELRDRVKQCEEQTPQLEKELEQSRTEAEELRDRVEQLEEQMADTTRTERTESEAAMSELQEKLSRSVNGEKEQTENLKMKTAELDQYRLEETQRGEARELKYYRLLESERTRWETREQRALDELDHMRRAREENTTDDNQTAGGSSTTGAALAGANHSRFLNSLIAASDSVRSVLVVSAICSSSCSTRSLSSSASVLDCSSSFSNCGVCSSHCLTRSLSSSASVLDCSSSFSNCSVRLKSGCSSCSRLFSAFSWSFSHVRLSNRVLKASVAIIVVTTCLCNVRWSFGKIKGGALS